jgi:hypothetical protein
VNTSGVYKVTYEVTDDAGITGAATANIIVTDEEPPVLQVHQTVTTIGMYDVSSSKQLHDLLLENVTAYDGGIPLDDSAIVVDYSEILEQGYGNCHVKYRAKDTAGNQSEVVVLVVDVDMEAPVLTLKNPQQGEIHVSSMLEDSYLLSLVQAEDNSGSVELTMSRPLTYTVGEPYVVLYCASDAFGNVSTLSVTYHLKE